MSQTMDVYDQPLQTPNESDRQLMRNKEMVLMSMSIEWQKIMFVMGTLLLFGILLTLILTGVGNTDVTGYVERSEWEQSKKDQTGNTPILTPHETGVMAQVLLTGKTLTFGTHTVRLNPMAATGHPIAMSSDTTVWIERSTFEKYHNLAVVYEGTLNGEKVPLYYCTVCKFDAPLTALDILGLIGKPGWYDAAYAQSRPYEIEDNPVVLEVQVQVQVQE